VERALNLLAEIGIPPAEKSLRVWIPDEEKQRVEKFLKKNGIDIQRLVGIQLSSRIPANRWSLEKFVALTIRLTGHDRHFVVLTWGPGDEALAKQVLAQADSNVFLYPTPTFKSLGALQERCRVFISPDGGAMHLATAVGTPTVGLFGKTDPRSWGPWGNGHVALRQGKNADLISVDEVYQVLQKWIEH
jgi:heptosyltransferase-3